MPSGVGHLFLWTMKIFKRNWVVPKGVEPTELDRKVMFYQERGHIVPRRNLIKTPEQIEGIRRSGVVNTGVLDLVEKEIHPQIFVMISLLKSPDIFSSKSRKNDTEKLPTAATT